MLQRPSNKKLMANVLQAAKACSIDIRPCTIKDIINLEIYFKDYQIMVIDASYKITNNPLYLNKIDKFNKHLYVFHDVNHYNVIESMGSFLNKSYYCNLCKKVFYHLEEH